MGRRVDLPDCSHEVAYASVKVRDRMVVSILGYSKQYRIKKIEQEPCWSLDDDRKLENRHVAKTLSGLVICLHTGNVLSWRTDGYEFMPKSYFVGSPYRGKEKCSSGYAPGEH